MKLFSFLVFGVLWLSGCQTTPSENQENVFYGVDHPHIRYTGRFVQEENSMRFAWSGSRIDLTFTGTSINVILSPVTGANPSFLDNPIDYYHVILDGKQHTIRLSTDEPIAFSGLKDTSHDLCIFKRTEALVAEGIFEGVVLDPEHKLLPVESPPSRRIEFIGNSITCGYGNEGDHKDCNFSPETENAWLTYSHLTARKLDAQYVSVCYSGKGVYQNYDKTQQQLMPELWRKYSPSIATDWHFQWIPELVVINLGTNDFAHIVPPQAEFVEAYQAFIREVIQVYPEVRIVCLSGPMMNGSRLDVLQSYLQKIVGEFSPDQVYRFDLSPQGELGMGCNWHPNVAQHTKNAQELSEFLSKLFNK